MGISAGPKITTDGLVLHIDATNNKSYSGSGITIFNMVTGGIAGTLVNGSQSDVAYKKTFLLDGTNDTIQMQLPSGIVTGSPITVSLWAKWKSVGTSTTTIQTLVDNQYQVADNIGFFIQDRPDLGSVLEWTTQPNNTVNRRVYSTQVVGDGSWHHIVGTNDGTYSRLYVDGYETGTAKTSAGIATTQDMLCIGNWAYVYSSPRYLNGSVSNFKVYNRALSATEILTDYFSTKNRFFPNENIVRNGLVLNYDYSLPTSYVGFGNTINDLSGSGITATLVSGPSYSRTSGGAISFDGVDDYLLTNSVNLSSFNSITLTFWSKILNYRETVGASNIIAELSSNYNNTTGGFNVSFGDDSAAGFGSVYPITLAVKGNSGYNFATYSKTLVNDLGWHHWACVFDKSLSSSEVALYIDGNIKTPSITFLSNNTNNFDNTSLYLSNRAPGNFSISNLQLYNRALSATEVTQNFNAMRERYNI